MQAFLKFLSCWLICTLMGIASASAQDAPDHEEPTRELNYVDAVILGVVEGITEYLPISSTGHLILTNKLLGLDLEEQQYSDDGVPLTFGEVDAQTGEPVPYTLKHAADAYVIVIQGGAILAVLILYWRRIWSAASGTVFTLAGWMGKPIGDPQENKDGLMLTRNLILAFIPAAVLGLLLEDLIDRYLFEPKWVIVALVAGAFLMFGVEAWRKRTGHGNAGEDEGPDLHQLSIGRCLTIGFLQCVAMWPGTSRSMMTIVGGYVVGLSPRRAAEFSFLLGLITLSAASGWKLLKPALKGDPTLFQVMDFGPVFFGILVATVAAALAVKWLVGYLTKHGLGLFAWYRIGLAVIMAIYLYV